MGQRPQMRDSLSRNAAWEAAVEVAKGLWVSLNWSDMFLQRVEGIVGSG